MDTSSPQSAAVTEILVNLAQAAEAVVHLYEREGPKTERILSQVEEMLNEVIHGLRPPEGDESPMQEDLQPIDRARAVARERGWPEAVEALDRIGVSLTRLQNRHDEPLP